MKIWDSRISLTSWISNKWPKFDFLKSSFKEQFWMMRADFCMNIPIFSFPSSLFLQAKPPSSNPMGNCSIAYKGISCLYIIFPLLKTSFPMFAIHWLIYNKMCYSLHASLWAEKVLNPCLFHQCLVHIYLKETVFTDSGMAHSFCLQTPRNFNCW